MIHTTCLALTSLVLASCMTHPEQMEAPPEEALAHQKVSPGNMVRTGTPVGLKEIYWNEEEGELFLRYDAEGDEYYGFTDRDTEQIVTTHFDWFPVFQVHVSDKATFDSERHKAVALRVEPHTVWIDMVMSAVNQLTPAQPGEGVLLNSRDEEFFVYRTKQGDVQIVQGMMNKPRGIPMLASYRFESLGETLTILLKDYLDQQGIEDNIIVFATGETGPYARPFAIFRRSDGLLLFCSLEPFTFGSTPGALSTTAGKSAWQFTRSYWLEFLNRPVSFFSRLGYFVRDTVWDISAGVSIRTFAYPDAEGLEIPPVNEGPGMDLEAWEAELDDVFAEKTYLGKAELLIGGDQFFPRVIAAGIDAQESIKLRTYIFDNDDFSVSIADLLKERSFDVSIQVMVDGLGTQMAQTTAPETLPEDFEAPIAITRYMKDDSNIEVRSLTNPWFTGDHTKTTIIDSKLAFIGGMNIGREYRWEWHDLMLEVTGPVVNAIEYEFDSTWAHAAILGDFVYAGYSVKNSVEETAPREGDYPIRLLKTRPSESQIYRAQIYAIRNAKSYAWVENAYFASPEILYELVKARLRGVDVRVIMPLEGNHGIMNANNVRAANTLLRYGARVYTYPGMSHIKASIIDGWACLGSANFDKLSFRVNKEMNVGISHTSFVNGLKAEVFEADMRHSIELLEPLPENWHNTFSAIVASQL
jgi:cardiolipin synthase